MTLIVLHGVESVGKTTIARELSAYFGAEFLPEFGRSYCEINGTDCAADDLLKIGHWQQRNIETALKERALVFSDTDALMTAAWARMMIGRDIPELMKGRKGDLYLYCAPDTPFVEDGLRVYGHPRDRARFDEIARDVLEEAGVDWVPIRGPFDRRIAQAIDHVRRFLALTGSTA
jgi:HTH-type transcriptional repressor of NAD biosynthesis genes